MKINLIIIILLMLTPLGIASPQNITPDEIIAGNTTVINDISQLDITPDNITTGDFTTTNESDAVYWYKKGEELLNASKYNESIEAYDRAIDLNQSYAEAWNHKGNALYDLGKKEEAIRAYRKAIEINPNFAKAWYNTGARLYQLERYNESLEYLDRAIELDPKFTWAWNVKGNALSDLGKYDEAIKAFDEAIKLDPKDLGTWYGKGFTLTNQGKYNEAAKALGEANRLQNIVALDATALERFYSPDWLEVTTYGQGRGMKCYIILHNQAGSVIRSDGTLRIEIYEGDSATKLWSKSYSVRRQDFVDTTLGMGPFAQPATIFSIDRISYDTIKPGLGDLSSEKLVTLEIRAYFETNNGKTLKDKTTEYVS